MLRDPFRRRSVPVLYWIASIMLASLSTNVNGSPPESNPGKNEKEPRIIRRFSASDLNRLEHGIHLPRVGTYTVKIWSSSKEHWILETTKGGAWSFKLERDGSEGPPAWKTAGTINVESLVSPIRFSFDRGTRDIPKSVPSSIWIVSDADFDPSPAALDVARGRIDSSDSNQDPRRLTVRTNREGVDFRAPASPEEWKARANALREQVRVALGLLPEWPKTPLHPIVRAKVERDGYTTENVALETLPGFYLCGTLYRPLHPKGKSPGLLCPHGHWKEGRMVADVQKRCSRWAQMGCVVFMYDMVGYNDSQAFGHEFLNDNLRRWGLSLPSLQTWNSIRALDWLTTLADVDSARIGMTGESGGGTQTFLLTAIDDRIRVAAPAVMVSEGFQGGCVCENAAGLRIGTDNVEIAALCAPRPLMMVGATGDWTIHTMSRAYPAIRDVFRLIGDPSNVHARAFDFPHNYNQTSREAVYAWMAPRLLGDVDPKSFAETPQSVATAGELLVFDKDHPAPGDLRSASELESALVSMLTKRLEELAPPKNATTPWDAGRLVLKTIHRVRVDLENPLPKDLAERDLRVIDREDDSLGAWTIRHFRVSRTRHDEEIPVVSIERKRPETDRSYPSTRAFRALTILVHPRGKAGLTDEAGKPIPLVVELLKRDQLVVGFDPLFTGEAFDPSSPFSRRPETIHFDTYNAVPAVDRMQDLATVVAWSKTRLRGSEVNVIGLGAFGPLVLLARPSIEGIARTAVDLHGIDLDNSSSVIPAEIDIPGVLQFGGLAGAASLISPAALFLFHAESSDRNRPARAYGSLDASQRMRVEKAGPSPTVWIDPQRHIRLREIMRLERAAQYSFVCCISRSSRSPADAPACGGTPPALRRRSQSP